MKTNKEWLRYRELQAQRPDAFVNNGQLTIISDETSVETFENATGRTIGVLFESPFHLMVVDLVESPDGKRFAYERLMPAVQKGAVVAVPFFQGNYVLLKQYRHALRREQYAFPRGFAEPGVSSAANVLKELREELGADTVSCQFIGSVVADSGVEGNEVSVYACELTHIELKYQYEGIEKIIVLSDAELRSWIASGKIDDGFTLSAYCLYQNKNR